LLKNVLMIVADTVRTDYLGVHGGDVHTPNLDRLARESVDFTRTRAASFPTVPTRGDYATGRYALTSQGWGPLPPGQATVAQIARKAGVTTVGVADTPFYTVKGYNLDRGFTYFYDMKTQDMAPLNPDPRHAEGMRLIPEPRRTEFDCSAASTMMRAEQCLELLADMDRFFLLVDTWDPHEPWDTPHPYVRRYKPDFDGRTVNPVYGRYAEHGVSEGDMETARASYKAELEMVDRWIGRLLERLDVLGLAGETAVMFTSDHGFYLGEHGLFGKMIGGPRVNGERRWLRSPLYAEVVDVPLFVRVPGLAPRRDDRVVSAIDLAPSILELLGLEPPEAMVGRSIVPALQSLDAPGREVAISAMPLATPGDKVALVDDITRSVEEWQPITVTSAEWTLVFSRWQDPIELFRAGSAEDVAKEHPAVVERLVELMLSELQLGGAQEADLRPRRREFAPSAGV
jgi:arylsulfatase A-like enzyme